MQVKTHKEWKVYQGGMASISLGRWNSLLASPVPILSLGCFSRQGHGLAVANSHTDICVWMAFWLSGPHKIKFPDIEQHHFCIFMHYVHLLYFPDLLLNRQKCGPVKGGLDGFSSLALWLSCWYLWAQWLSLPLGLSRSVIHQKGLKTWLWFTVGLIVI